MPELKNKKSIVRVVVSNIEYDLNPPEPIFKPLFKMGNEYIGLFDNGMWGAAKKLL